MKALSIRQPWVWAIFNAGKDIENRDWPTRLRGRVAIHAAKGMTHEEYMAARIIIADNTNLSLYPPPENEIERGVILGTVEIVDCVQHSGSPWFFGDYGFVLKSPRLLVEPISCRGALGFWDVPEDIACLLR